MDLQGNEEIVLSHQREIGPGTAVKTGFTDW
jgi:hypothetical protein